VTSDTHASRRGNPSRRANVSRREVVGGVLAGTLTCALPLAASAAESRPLKAIAADKGILFGSAVGGGRPGTLTGSFNDPRYLDILKRECSVLVPENELKNSVIAREKDRYNFEPGDRIAAFAKSSGIKLRGHNLLWNKPEYTPKWLLESFGTLSSEGGERWLRDYIGQVCRHYGDQIHSWDVVNETIDPKTGEIRETPFTRVLGFDVLRIAYEAARESAPHAQLVYNDYMSWNAADEKHRAGVLKLLEQFKTRKVPVDALGVQGHLGSGAGQHREWRSFIDAVVSMGYGLLITEFDISDKDVAGDIKARDARVAAVGRDYLDMMLSYRQLDQVLCWGMVDKYSWLQRFSARDDKAPLRPDPYDENYQPKRLREAIAAALMRARRA
jgi:endo-1,4-beta-xylanase